MKYVVFYESAPDAAAKIMKHIEAHRAWWGEFRDRGTLLAIGPYADGSGAIGVFTSREAAEEYIEGDPFVVEGVMRTWTIREWNEVLL
jgi:uncharacterized protein